MWWKDPRMLRSTSQWWLRNTPHLQQRSITLLVSTTNAGILTLVKWLQLGNRYLGLNFWSIALNPGLSTVEIGSISFAKQYVTDLVSSLYSQEEEESGFTLSHVVSSDGCTDLSFCCFLLVLGRVLCTISYSSGYLFFRWLYKFEVFPSFAAISSRQRQHFGWFFDRGFYVSLGSNPKYFHIYGILFWN